MRISDQGYLITIFDHILIIANTTIVTIVYGITGSNRLQYIHHSLLFGIEEPVRWVVS